MREETYAVAGQTGCWLLDRRAPEPSLRLTESYMCKGVGCARNLIACGGRAEDVAFFDPRRPREPLATAAAGFEPTAIGFDEAVLCAGSRDGRLNVWR